MFFYASMDFSCSVTSAVSPSLLRDNYSVTRKFEWSANPSRRRPSNKNFRLQSSDNLRISNVVLSIKSHVKTVLGTTCFQTRKKEYQRNLKNYTKGSNATNHVWQNSNSIDFDNVRVIDKGNYRVRKTLES